MRATVGAAWYCTKCTDCRVSTRQRNTQPVRTRSAVERAARAALLPGLAGRLFRFSRIRGERGPPCERRGAWAGDRGGYPCVVAGGAERNAAEEEREQRTAHRNVRPPPESDELLSTRMLFDAHEQPGGAEESTPDFEVPAGVPTAAQHARAIGAQAGFHGVEPLLPLLAPLAPNRRRDRPERRPPRLST